MPSLQSFKLQSIAYKKLIAKQTNSPIRKANSVSILTNGDEIFPSMLAAIKSAKTSISFLTYVYWRGDIATEFAQTLSRKAKAGVKVSVLLDAFGSSKIDNQLIDHMQQAGVSVLWFRPLRWYTLHKLNNRTHRKILIIDNIVGFVGGVGIAQEWTGHAQDVQHWRDTHFKVKGPAIKDLLASFNGNWTEAGGKKIAYRPSSTVTRGKTTLQITSSQGGKSHTQGEALFYTSIRQAKKYINITTAYFAPSKHFRHALIEASRLGVNVTILTNGHHTNHSLVRRAGHRHYHSLLAAGITIYEYQPTLLHAKTMTIDNEWATVGSINFDDRSFILNDEISMSLTDQKLIKKLDDQLTSDLTRSKRITLHRWRRRPHLAKLSEILSDSVRKQL
ncbi:MAG: phosphatidylserine/phosphatidylglycerophosphate/cardiolipin synthase family protein [Candidatus Saccharimonadales bacterium]